MGGADITPTDAAFMAKLCPRTAVPPPPPTDEFTITLKVRGKSVVVAIAS